MRKALVVALFTLAMVAGLSAPASAQEQGRPDPTGQGRYIHFGHEVSYPGARVLKQLPAGVECAPAGELVGVRVWNSTREGKAILSELTEKANVAVVGTEIFLCGCAGGYNQLFLEKTQPTPQPPPQTQAQPQPPPPTETSSREIEELKIQIWQLQQQAAATPPPAPVPATPVATTTTKKSRFSLHFTLVLNGGQGERYRDGYVRPPYVRPGVLPGGNTGPYYISPGGNTGGYAGGGYTTGYNPGGYTTGYVPPSSNGYGGNGGTGYYY